MKRQVRYTINGISTVAEIEDTDETREWLQLMRDEGIPFSEPFGFAAPHEQPKLCRWGDTWLTLQEFTRRSTREVPPPPSNKPPRPQRRFPDRKV